MNNLKVLKKTVIESQFYVSLMGTLFSVFFMIEQNTFKFPAVFLIFTTYFSGYLYTKYQNTIYFNKILIVNILAGILCVIISIINHDEIHLLKWFTIVILGLLYNSIFLETHIRKIPLLKVFYVGLVWGLINSWLAQPQFNAPVFFISFLWVTALILPFDIRDMKSDTIQTFPKIIGIQNTKYLAYFLTFLSCIISIFYLKIDFAISFFIGTIFTFIAIYLSENTNNDTYFSFWVESCLAIPFLFLVIMKYF